MSRPNARSAITGRGVIFGDGFLDCSLPINKRIHQIIAIREKKTVRFAELVKKFGKPEQVVLWSALEDDRDFSKAIKERRVVTVFQQNVGSKKDYGLVGFFQKPGTVFLVFPKAISYADETKVVGIKYEQVQEQEPEGELFKPTPKNLKQKEPGHRKMLRAEREEPKSQTKRGLRAGAKRPEPRQKHYRFESRVKIIAEQEITISTEAASVQQAKKLLEEQAKELQLDLGQAEVRRTLSKPIKRGKVRGTAIE